MISRNKYSSIASYFMAFYAPLAITYWIPNFGMIANFKILYISCLCIFALLVNSRRFRLHKGVIYFFTLAFISIIPSFYLSKSDALLDFFTNVFIVVAFCVTISNLSIPRNEYKHILNIVSFGVLIPVTIHLLGIFFLDFNNVLPIDLPYTYFKDIGLNVSRTGWSASLALFVPIFFIQRSNFQAIILLIPLLLSQFLCAGRGGFLASIIAILIILFYRRKIGLLILIGVVISGLFIYYYEEVEIVFRLYRLTSGFDSLNSFSAGRISSYILSFDLFLDNPIFGIGYGNMDLSNSLKMRNVHNAFLYLITELGMFSIFFFAGLYLLLKPVLKTDRLFNVPLMAPVITLLFLMMIEPSVLFRSFQNSFGFWTYYFLKFGKQ